jgi:hypothetical protein
VKWRGSTENCMPMKSMDWETVCLSMMPMYEFDLISFELFSFHLI